MIASPADVDAGAVISTVAAATAEVAVAAVAAVAAAAAAAIRRMAQGRQRRLNGDTCAAGEAGEASDRFTTGILTDHRQHGDASQRDRYTGPSIMDSPIMGPCQL